ncbi:hypothetical protein DSL92_04620 [Billgrantia gudaonensis]|uniref:Uncharacterized protein n=1 Tax=Billgrantia gudaonensis TaxID=376427 RepID=A0A3S0QG34_9GAMM|nr:hypothetical protein DSL92_04620 [Halomonas gudaonensis]
MAARLSSFWLGGGVVPGGSPGAHPPVIAVGAGGADGSRRRHREGPGTPASQWMLGAYLGLVAAFAGTLMPGRWVAWGLW